MMIMQSLPPGGTTAGTAPAHPKTATPGRSELEDPQLVEELRTIATCVLGFTELLGSSALPLQDRRVYLGVLQAQATRLARIVDELDGAAARSDALPKPPG